MPEAASRILLAAELVVIVLPASLFVVPFALPAALVLTPIALLGLVKTVLAGGPETADGIRIGLELLLMPLLGLCALAALFLFMGLAGRFLLLGRQGLRGRSRLARRTVLLALPPLLLSSLPRLATEVAATPLDLERVMAALLYGGVPLLVPAAHLLAELRASQRSPP